MARIKLSFEHAEGLQVLTGPAPESGKSRGVGSGDGGDA